jgi:rhodanese-related sulfurtransferase
VQSCMRWLVYLVLMAFGYSSIAVAQISPLPVIDNELRANFPNVASIKAADLQTLLSNQKRPIILDVRAPEEFAISHLPGAVRIDPGAKIDDVLRAIGQQLNGRDVIVYCSVGLRSTELADRMREGLKAKGAGRIANLSEGIFGWHNANRPLMQGAQATSYVHPYDALWGQLLRQQNLTTYAPVLQGQKRAAGSGFDDATLYIIACLGVFVLLALAASLRPRWLRQPFGSQKS